MFYDLYGRKPIRRKRVSLFPPEPPNLASLVIANPFDKIDRERDFLQLDDTAPDRTRLIVSATVESLGHLSQKTEIQTLYVIDATFASSVRQLCALSFLPSHRIRRVPRRGGRTGVVDFELGVAEAAEAALGPRAGAWPVPPTEVMLSSTRRPGRVRLGNGVVKSPWRGPPPSSEKHKL
ncbi:hypothetical protein HPB47_025400 [Ixodes persulcatus]|uniref:Uncharacterized protein n=1 Tax=Ixodes persulcatus TaxID=34615 RepID=A0AC60Q3G0_IXOPE|nr:hypothetical protein HPB47_025400 [Ixodes persulcatus]